ncbi:MAG: type II toxin-antitoxin system HicA family toxin [Bacteroidales bacterium]|nr:type II toxin-antitoxin system HicA family toxin [Bacteroidales bacterium]
MSKGGRNIPLKSFRSYLEWKGLKKIRAKGGHEVWSKNDLSRPIVIQSHIDPVPLFVVKTNLKTLGVTIKDYETFLLS